MPRRPGARVRRGCLSGLVRRGRCCRRGRPRAASRGGPGRLPRLIPGAAAVRAGGAVPADRISSRRGTGRPATAANRPGTGATCWPGTGARPGPVGTSAWRLPWPAVAWPGRPTVARPTVAAIARAVHLTAVGRAVAPPPGRIRARNRRRTVAHRLLAVRLRRNRATRGLGPLIARGPAVLQIRIAHPASVSFYGLRIARSGIFPRPGRCLAWPRGSFLPAVFARIPRRSEGRVPARPGPLAALDPAPAALGSLPLGPPPGALGPPPAALGSPPRLAARCPWLAAPGSPPLPGSAAWAPVVAGDKARPGGPYSLLRFAVTVVGRYPYVTSMCISMPAVPRSV